MEEPTPRRIHTAEEATPKELWWASIRLLLMLGALVLLVFPVIGDLPVGATTRTSVLAWLLVALALYWLYSGLGYRPLLLLQLALFSAAATFVTAKAMLVLVDIDRFSVLRRVARGLLYGGLGCAGLNLIGMLWRLLNRRTKT